MANVEDSPGLVATNYSRNLNFTYDSSLNQGDGGFRYVFEQGGIRCQYAAARGSQACLVSRREMNAVDEDRPTFVYMDVGCWADDSDGEGTRRRDFGLVCGPHAYLCEYVGDARRPASRVTSVRRFFSELGDLGCGVNVVGYAKARLPLATATLSDTDLYLIVGDFHMPPVSWFFTQNDLVGLSPSQVRELPDWLENCGAIRRQPDWLLRNYYSLAANARDRGSRLEAHKRLGGVNPDIFRFAGADLARFLGAIAGLSAETRGRIHFIQLGDMFETWLGRDYEFVVSQGRVVWKDSGSANRVANWSLEIMIQNTPVFSALRRLSSAGLREMKYLWGNHDAYMMKRDVTGQLGIASRDPYYAGLNGSLIVEHGHRVDGYNWDFSQAQVLTGHDITTGVWYVPTLRSLEPLPDRLWAKLGLPTARDYTFLGASIEYLYERYDRQVVPFGIYVIGHTHRRKLNTFKIRTQYHLYDQS